MGINHAEKFEKGIKAIMNSPVYKDRFSVDIIFLREENPPRWKYWRKPE